MGPVIFSCIWETIGSVHESLDLVLSCLLNAAETPQIGTKSYVLTLSNVQYFTVLSSERRGGEMRVEHFVCGRRIFWLGCTHFAHFIATLLIRTSFELLEQMIVALACQNPQLVSGKLIARLLKLLRLTSKNPKSDLAEHDNWPSIAILVRILLMLSFENLIYVQQYLPELFHIIIMTFHTGSSIMRATVHGLLINIVHSLYTSTNLPDHPSVSKLRYCQSAVQLPPNM